MSERPSIIKTCEKLLKQVEEQCGTGEASQEHPDGTQETTKLIQEAKAVLAAITPDNVAAHIRDLFIFAEDLEVLRGAASDDYSTWKFSKDSTGYNDYVVVEATADVLLLARFLLARFIPEFADMGKGLDIPLPHTDDLAVNRFALGMKRHLQTARERGRKGWEGATSECLSKGLISNLLSGDLVDVANFAMMLHLNNQKYVSRN